MTLWQILTSPIRYLIGILKSRSQNTSQISFPQLNETNRSSRATLKGRLIHVLEITTCNTIALNGNFVIPKDTTFYIKEPTHEFFRQAKTLARNRHIVGRYWLERTTSYWKRDGF